MENVAVELGEGEELPGGDAMFELFTRVYCAKESMVLQLEVRECGCARCSYSDDRSHQHYTQCTHTHSYAYTHALPNARL